MKKKAYKQPQIEVVRIESAQMLATSTGIGNDATGPARAPLYYDEE